jgi:Uma2 family endonuclease
MATPSSTHHSYDIFRRDRPGWIPEWVGDDWDPNPYAYQTREELMPAGRFHYLYVQMLAEMLGPLLKRLGLELLIDVFIFYRDWEGRKQRVAPDMLIAPITELSDEQKVNSYDLDVEPLPLCVFELVSPTSRERDQEHKPFLYAALGIDECLVLDILDEQERLRPQIDISLWRLSPYGMAVVAPDDEGYVTLTAIDVRVRADGRRLVAQDVRSGELLRTSVELLAALDQAEQARAAAEQARADAERRALAAEGEAAQLRAELERLRASRP